MMQWAVALATLVPLFTHLTLCRRKPNILEENQTKTTLHILDDNLVEYLSKPSSDTAPLIFLDLKSYNKHFKEIINGFKERKFRYVRIAHVMYDKGGPTFMNIKIDPPMLFKVNRWNMAHLGELHELLMKTRRLWLEFKSIYEEVKTAVKGNWTQLKTTFHGTLSPSGRWNITAMFENRIESNEVTGMNITKDYEQ